MTCILYVHTEISKNVFLDPRYLVIKVNSIESLIIIIPGPIEFLKTIVSPLKIKKVLVTTSNFTN